MSVNSSWSSRLPLNLRCFVTTPVSFVFFTFNVTNVLLLLPLCIFILHRGLRRRRKRSSSSSSSHSDVLSYHIVAVEMGRVLGCVLCCGGVFMPKTDLLLAGTLLLFLTWYGQLFFHALTCVERHLAVVHPLTYRNLRNQRGVRIRNVGIGGAWLLSIVKTGLLVFEDVVVMTDLGLFILTLTVVSFCSLSAVRVLIRPGPGSGGGAKGRVDQSKQRASWTIVAIMGVLALRFTGNLVWAGLHLFGGRGYCVLVLCEIWINMSNSLLFPSLFLYRTWKVSVQPTPQIK